MDSAKTLEDFKEILKNYEIETFSKFNVYTSPKGFLDEKREISEGMRLHWKDGLPYFHFGSRIYTCHQGKDKNLGKKKKYEEEKKEKAKSDHIFQQTYNLTQTTKKLDCPASITVIRVYTLPEFKLENPTKSKKNVVSAEIRSKLKNNEDVKGEEVFWFTLPSVDAHKNHMQGEISAITEPVDPAVRSKIKEFVCEGKRNALVIAELLEIFVKTELKQNDKKRRRFFPDIPTVKRIIKEAKRDIRYSKIDMENTYIEEDKLQAWRRAIPRSHRVLSSNDKVCEFHFLPEEISRHFTHKMPDGTVVMIEREKSMLAADAVPSIFPSLPAYYSKNKKKRKPPMQRMPLEKKIKKKKVPEEDTNIVEKIKRNNVPEKEANIVEKIKRNNVPEEDTNIVVDCTMPRFPVSSLIETLVNVRKPNKFWSVSSHEDFIVCAKWDTNFAPERQIIIDADLGIKLMYYGSVALNKPSLTVNTVDDLSHLIMEVDKYLYFEVEVPL